MAYAQWAKILIKSKSVDLAITHVNLYYGKFHVDNNKEHEIKIAHNQILLIPKNGELLLCTCGREASPSGTDGSFDIYTGDGQKEHGSVLIGTYTWECPWGNKNNTHSWYLANSKYKVVTSGGNPYDGALGNITLSVEMA